MKKPGTYQQRSSTGKDTKEEPQWDRQEGQTRNKIKSHTHPYPPRGGGRPTDTRKIVSLRFSHRSKSSGPHVRLPSLGSAPGNWPPEHLALKASRALLQEPHRTRGNREFTLNGTHKVSHAPWHRAKAVMWQKPGLGLLLVLERLLERWEATAAHPADTDTGGGHNGEHLATWKSLLQWLAYWTISSKPWPQPTACREQCWDASGQQPTGWGQEPHKSADRPLKD